MSEPATENAADDSWVPRNDMVFESDEKAYQFYCLYAKEMGFGVRKHFVKRRSSGLVYSRVFCCYKEGFCRSLKEGKKPRPDSRTGCKAHITVRIMDDGRFRVTEFDPNHNHELIAKANETETEPIDKPASVKKAAKKNVNYRSISRSYIPSKPTNFTDDRVPRVDMEFENDEEAYNFYFNYAINIGFSVRKHLIKRRASGLIYSRTYCCHKEGHTRKRDEQVQERNPKPYDRSGCLASMTIKITKSGRYRVIVFEPKHNHALVVPTKAHLFKWQWRRGLIKSPNDQRLSSEQAETQVPTSITSHNKNAMMVGDVGAILQYMQEKQAEDPFFYYALRLEQDDQLMSVFWTDGKSKVDFDYFDDVICFDTSYKTSDYRRPFALFIGVNHHKQAIIFGQALTYDETVESFKWLFEAFKSSMCGKQPKLILTEKSEAISNAIAEVWPGTIHRFCVWQLYNNAVKHLNFVFEGSTTFAKDFSRCIYEIEEEEQFVSEWKSLLEKYDLNSNTLLANLYEDREKWSLAYERHAFYGDVKSVLVKDNMNDALKKYLDSENLLEFFKHYENIVKEQLYAELQADFNARQGLVKTHASRMLRQASNVYTPAVLKVFQAEFDMSIDYMVYNCGQIGTVFEYKVTAEDHPNEFIVTFDSSNGSIFCSCKKFEVAGIQCRHVLKVLDIINIKELPPKYILKRWTKDAKATNQGEVTDSAVNSDSKSSKSKRYRTLCSLLNKVAEKASGTVESYNFVENLSDQLMDQVCKLLLQSARPEKPYR
ncbi:protein FAR1-RELATED SEQUENCE 5-like [Asparagus officinalis]|uniref:protein FAR1-RELATED SEQUENCE 5-like n=1 Tax=Asparagus officinalis TaxID=4686 RepID=UPI00098E66AC|nr:protein FAR1-RELATED SEQUENCE 5-like [Asparagus officinalis]